VAKKQKQGRHRNLRGFRRVCNCSKNWNHFAFSSRKRNFLFVAEADYGNSNFRHPYKMKKSQLILLGLILLLNFVGCSDDPASPPSTDPVDANQTTKGETNATVSPHPEANGTATQAWFGPPQGAELILSLRPGQIETSSVAKLTDWIASGFEGNFTIPSPLPLALFSKGEPVYLFVEGAETSVLGVASNPVNEKASIPGFTVVNAHGRRAIVTGESPESIVHAQSILADQPYSASTENLRSFVESFSSAGLYIAASDFAVDLGSAPGSLSASVRSLNSETEPVTPSGNLQWGVVPGQSAAFFGATDSNTLLQPFAHFLLARLSSEHNATGSWALRFAQLLDSGGATGQSFPNPSGGHLFALAPPSDANGTITPFPVPAKLKSTDSALLVDFAKLGPLLKSGSSSLLDRPAFSLACEKAKQLTIGSDAKSLDLKLTWLDSSEDGLSSLFSFLEALSVRRTTRSFYEAILRNDVPTVMRILETKDISSLNLAGGISPLHFCAWQGKIGVLKVCLDKGLQVDRRDDSNRTPLHMAAWSGNPEAAQLLLDRNASVDLLNNDGATPAMEAARIGNPGTLDLLLASGADVNASDARGNGLVEYAASGGHKALVTILKRRGAPPRNTLHIAAGIGDLAALRSQFPDNNSTDANTLDGWGATPLLYAASGGQSDAFDYLLEKGADPRIQDELGLTLVHAAAMSGNSRILAKALDLGLEVNARHAERGATALDWAIARKDGVAADALRSAGAKTGWELQNQP
jgi:ankyrin repeat protein